MEHDPPSNHTAQTARLSGESRAVSFVGTSRQNISTRFGQALRARRKQQGMTQADLSVRAEVSRSYISEVECGRENVSLEWAARLAHALDCRLADLL
ncbi:MAG: helix-turn-helix domain-containing protein [Chloroflexota bacterium]|nr:helix-turn-helix domain-containing protein [Chloroflexota bacterium]